jgi:heme/copper-type cytochrome/quinol oxidase subunit 3
MVKAFAAIQVGNQKGLKLWLLATIVIGAIFVGIQVLEYNILIAEHFVPNAEAYAPLGRGVHDEGAPVVGGPLYGATFFTMTGFHGAHVTIGVLCLMFVLFKSMRGAYTQDNHAGVEIIGLYWHFVDLVWIILFTIVYLI